MSSETKGGHTSRSSAPSDCSPQAGSWRLSPLTSLLHQRQLGASWTSILQAWVLYILNLFPHPGSPCRFTQLPPLPKPGAGGRSLHKCSPSLHAPEALSPGRTFPPHSRYKPREQPYPCTWTHRTNLMCTQLPKSQGQQRPQAPWQPHGHCSHEARRPPQQAPGWQEEGRNHTHTYPCPGLTGTPATAAGVGAEKRQLLPFLDPLGWWPQLAQTGAGGSVDVTGRGGSLERPSLSRC